MFHWDDLLIIVSLILQLGVIAFLLEGAFRGYPLVLAYSLARLITSALELVLRVTLGDQTAFFRRVYYSDRVILNLLLFVMVAALISRLLKGKPQRSMIGKALLGIAGVVLLLPFMVLSRPFTLHWLNAMSQFLYFGSGIMTMVLWRVLMRSEPRDFQLIKFTVGLGIAMTGAAIAFGLQQWMGSPRLVWMPNLFLQLTHVAGVLFWCWAFRPVKHHGSALPGALFWR